MTANTSISRGEFGKTHGHARQLIGWLALVGGVLIGAGTMLPWFSLFAGLQSYSGLVGLNGRLLLASGAISALAGVLFLVRDTLALRWGTGLLGFVQLAYSAWLMLQLLGTYHELASDPLMVAALGPGLFIILAGTALVFGTLFVKHE